ncbi:NHLP family bacteriocin export ABC transporter peptidase/permease/ATPase subunit [Fusibacter paucivorans]|uniref:NHLP family bacteriocin export ABC transporter peptidase/permease/ATPase subunit n=1 Tax=Fusibacter paucivorans TaxID=76009 RepID=A0ABS5PMT2_9FIRM|nr:NHLP family bacteriocin export ABC transporter peptidase/permease/ATPase subunit [Fusibacter paucivorans]
MAKVAKVPVIMQMENLECGAASLCMVLAYYGKWVPLEQVRVDCGISRDGSNAKNIILAARGYGFKASGYRKEPAALKALPLPAIIHWNFNHFVVLNGFKKNSAVINDPARGTVEVPMETFDKAFTGIVLCFEKTEDFVQSGRPKRVTDFVRSRLSGEGRSFAFAVVSGFVLAGITMATPLFSKLFMDYVLSKQHPEWLLPLMGAMFFAMCFQLLVHAVQDYYLMKLQGKLAIAASTNFLWHILHLPVDFFSQRHIGDIVNRQGQNETIAYTMINQLAPVLLNMLMLLIYVAVMSQFSLLLTAVSVFAALTNVVAMRYIGRKRAVMSQGVMRDAGKLSGVTMSGFEMMETIKASGAENGFFQRWAGYFAKYMNAYTTFQKSDRVLAVLPSLLQQLTNTAVLMIGVYLILEGHFTIGMLLAFQGFLAAFLTPVNELAGTGQAFTEMQASVARIDDVLKYPKDAAYEYSKQEEGIMPLRGDLTLNGITFGYSKLAPPLIEDFNLTLKRGQSVAFVGGSGSGKSTLAKLIAGLYQPWSGTITFDGRSVSTIPHDLITSGIAVVDQDIVLFEDSIVNNITMWDDTVDTADVVNACKDAEIHEDVMSRPGGYTYQVREGGKNFSGGQRQRFEIARALAGNPAIIIMDEATSALDTKTEMAIMDAVKRRNVTTIIVAHRLSTIRDCDEIIVLDRGKVIERGSHETLMTLKGRYAALIEN